MSVYRLNVYAFIWIRSMVSVRHCVLWPFTSPPPLSYSNTLCIGITEKNRRSLTILSIIYLILLKCLFHDRQQSTHTHTHTIDMMSIWLLFPLSSFVYRPKQTIHATKFWNQEEKQRMCRLTQKHRFCLIKKIYLH